MYNIIALNVIDYSYITHMIYMIKLYFPGVRTEADTYIVSSRKRIQLIGSTILGRQAMINIGITLLMLNPTTTTNNDNDLKKEISNNKKNSSITNSNNNNNSIRTNSKRTCISLQHVMHHKRFVLIKLFN